MSEHSLASVSTLYWRVASITLVALPLAIGWHLASPTISDRTAIYIVGILAIVLFALFAAFAYIYPRGVEIIHRSIASAMEGKLKPIELPAAHRLVLGPLAQDYNLLIRNIGSLFHEMEQSQHAIIADRNRFDAILTGLPGVLLTVDADLTVSLANRSAEHVFGRKPHEIVGRKLPELFALAPNAAQSLAEKFSARQQLANQEITLTNGSIARQFSLSITYFSQSPAARSHAGVVLLQDVTEHKRMQQLVYQSEKFLAIGKLAGGVAHELNTPLGTIMGYAQLMNEGELSEAKWRAYTQSIYKEAKRCSRIIDNLRSLARRDICQPETCALDRVIGNVVDTIKCCPASKESVRVEIGRNPPAQINCSDGQLEIVLVNLLMNAVQASKLSASDPCVEIDASVDEGTATVIVTDNGAGVPDGLREQIFDPFFTTKSDQMGMGLGLAISQSIVTTNGGSLTYDAQYKRGAKFVLKMPLAGGEQDGGASKTA
jgi:two-component system NtrC family sensor kinase